MAEKGFKVYEPTPEEIKELTEEMQRGWTKAQRNLRIRGRDNTGNEEDNPRTYRLLITKD